MTVVAPTWQRLEGLALLVLAALAYSRFGQGWALFAVLFLAPDLSFAGYLAGPRAGAWAYNLAHSLIGPLALASAGVAIIARAAVERSSRFMSSSPHPEGRRAAGPSVEIDARTRHAGDARITNRSSFPRLRGG